MIEKQHEKVYPSLTAKMKYKTKDKEKPKDTRKRNTREL